MKIIIFGAAGRQGSRLVDEALSRGHQVTAAVREPGKVTKVHPGLRVVRADALDADSVAGVAEGHDLAINAINPTEPGDGLVRAAEALRKGLVLAGVSRLLVVGGAASLQTAPGKLLLEKIPDEWKWIVVAHIDALAYYRTVDDLDWAYLSPSATLEPGTRTGKYRLGTDFVLADAAGNSRISMEDLAVVLLDEAETPAHHRQRFTAVQL